MKPDEMKKWKEVLTKHWDGHLDNSQCLQLLDYVEELRRFKYLQAVHEKDKRHLRLEKKARERLEEGIKEYCDCKYCGLCIALRDSDEILKGDE